MTRKRKALTALAVILALAIAATAYVEFCIHPYLRLAVRSGGVYSTLWHHTLEYAEGSTLDCYFTESQGVYTASFFTKAAKDRVAHLYPVHTVRHNSSVFNFVTVMPDQESFRQYWFIAQLVTDDTPAHALGVLKDEDPDVWALSSEVRYADATWWLVYGYYDDLGSFIPSDLVNFVAEQGA